MQIVVLRSGIRLSLNDETEIEHYSNHGAGPLKYIKYYSSLLPLNIKVSVEFQVHLDRTADSRRVGADVRNASTKMVSSLFVQFSTF